MGSTPAVEATQLGRHYLPPAGVDILSPNQHLMPLTAQVNAADHLEIGGCDVVELLQRFGSPLYILDETTLRQACRQYRDAFQTYYPGESLVLYASKAWNCLAVCAIAASESLGIDVVSGGELYTALQAGVSADHLYLHGNNKDLSELQLAIQSNCTIVVDNWHELKILAALVGNAPVATSEHQAIAPIPDLDHPVRIMVRLTPGIECHTHEYIRTGHIDSKFGFDPDQLESVFQFISQQSGFDFVGLHAHIGSQIFELDPHSDLTQVMVGWFQKAKDYNLPVRELDLGGGLGIRYTESDDPPSIDTWAKVICEGIVKACEQHQIELPKLLAEPGRSLIGTACVTAYTVGSQKTVPGIRSYIAVDGGMSDNPRPITYQSLYRAMLGNRMSAPMTETVTVAGKHCESGDILIQNAQLPPTQTGDTLVVPATGAYNYSMASNYNRVPRPAAVLVRDGEASVILRRETYQDLLHQDQLPDYLSLAVNNSAESDDA